MLPLPEINLPRRAFIAAALAMALGLLIFGQPTHAQQAPTPQLKIAGAVSTPLTLTPADLKTMQRKTLKIVNTHNEKSETYEGVPLEALLQEAGVPHGEAL